ncbi:hypothetical protein [Timonella sp. A28]|uniref:PH-like domain-containing protein n=1 Tax=Timonella sp. A28 TaxID=3442640 RepID=UPI003EBC2180
MTQAQAMSVMIGSGVLLLGLMWLGWRGRQRRTAPLVGSLPQAPQDGYGEQTFDTVPGTYISSTTHGDWLDRIATQDLGYRSAANLTVHTTGIRIERSGALDIFIPAQQVDHAETAPGIAGKVIGKDGIVLISWHVEAKYGDDTLLDTGFKPDHKAQRDGLINAINSLTQTHKENQ